MELDVMARMFVDLGDSIGTRLDGMQTSITNMEENGSGPKFVPRTVFGTAPSVVLGLNNYAICECSQAPAAGKAWNLRSITYLTGGPTGLPLDASIGGSTGTGFYYATFSTTVAAAAAGTLALTGASQMVKFQVSPGAAWATGGVVTVTNLQGGTANYEVPVGSASVISDSYPGTGIAAPFGTPTVNVPAMAGGPAYSITAIGTIFGNSNINTVATLYAASEVPEFASPNFETPNIAGMLLPARGPMTYYEDFGRWIKWVMPQQKLYAIFAGVAGTGTQTAFLAEVEEYNIDEVFRLRV